MSSTAVDESGSRAGAAAGGPEPAPLDADRERRESEVRAVLAQIAPRLGDVDHNLATHLEVIAEARAGDADLVVFPELSLTGYFLRDLVTDVALRLRSDEVRALAAATAAGPDVVVGLILETDDHLFHNAALHLSGGEIAHVHRKVYLPTYGLFDERRYVAAGDRIAGYAAGLDGWRCGTLICEDIWHPSAVAVLARQGLELLVVPSASPGRGVGGAEGLGTAASYDRMTRAYAELFTTHLLYCNRVGYEDGVGFWGGSRAVAPDGGVIGEPAGADEALVWHRLDAGALRRARIASPLLRDERHDITDAETDRLRSRPRR